MWHSQLIFVKSPVRTRAVCLKVGLKDSQRIHWHLCHGWEVQSRFHGDICIICLCFDSHSEAPNCAIASCELQAFQPFHYIQCHSPASPSLPIPPEEPGTFQQSTPVTEPIPPGLTYASDVTSLGLGQSLKLLLLVPHAVDISVEIIQVWYIEPAPHQTHWGLPLAFCFSSFGTPSHCSSLASLALSPSPFQAYSMLCPWAPKAPVLELLLLSGTSASCQGSVDHMLRTSHGQKTQNFSTDTTDPMDLPLPINITCCQQNWGNHCLCSWPCCPDPRALKALLVAWTSLCYSVKESEFI